MKESWPLQNDPPSPALEPVSALKLDPRRVLVAVVVLAIAVSALAPVAAAEPPGAAVAATLTAWSPGPVLAQPGGFADVAEDAYYAVPVASLAERGVFVGTECEDGFCPGDPLDRKTMAVWVVRVLDGEDPPAVTQTRFSDVDAESFHGAFVERMAELGVTAGCSDTMFCPDRTVARAQMAVFLSQAYELPDGADPGFSDVPDGAWYAADMARLAASGITAGCATDRFCPDLDTRRAQMATFLYHAENLPDTAETAIEYRAGDTIAGFPSGFSAASGNFNRASVSITGGGGTVTITMSHNGTAAYTATTYTCTSVGGCTILNGRVTTGTVNATATDETNRPPRFTSPATLTAPENSTAAGTVTAIDDDTADTVTGYAITGGADRSRLSITNTGQLNFNTAPDYEHPTDTDQDNTYQITVTATSGTGTRTNTATHTITVTITDTAEPPSAPAAPIATSTSDTTITLTWTEPANTGPTVNDYDIQYRTSGDTAWTDWPHTDTTRTATITDLTANTTYDTQVRATNPDGTSRWSTTTTATTVETETNTPDDTASGDPLASQRFRAITAGSSHSCGLRTDGTIQCWGSNWEGKAVAPSGQFSAVTVSYNHSCGLHTDGTIQCWGSLGELVTDAPDGQFTAITAGWRHSCGLRIDNTIQCWGSNSSDPPSGAFKTVTVDKWHSCGLRIDNTIQCWGGRNGNDAPDGQFTAITAGEEHSCGIQTDTSIKCWGNNSHGQADAPDGQFTAITAGEEHSCGIQTDTSIKCWGNNSHGQADAPDGQFTAITAGEEHSCGIQTDTSIKCWGNNSHGQADAPDGQFTAITAGEEHSCGIQTDASIKCWGDPDAARLEYPSFSRVYNVRWTSTYTSYGPRVRITWAETPMATYYQLYHCYTLSPVLDCTPRLIVSTIVGTEYLHYLTSQAVNSIIYIQYQVRACNETECSSRVAAIRD